MPLLILPPCRIVSPQRRVITQQTTVEREDRSADETKKGNNMKIKNTKGTRLAKPVTAVLLAGLLSALPPSAQGQFFGGFGGATSLAGAATLAGTTTLAGPPSCRGGQTLSSRRPPAGGPPPAPRDGGH